MEVPDKIYISPNIENRTWLIGKANTTSVEYICKGTLMELINKLRSIPHDNAIIRDNTFQEVINLINTL